MALQEDKLQEAVHFPSTERYMQAALNPPGPSSQDILKIRVALLGVQQQRRLFLFGCVGRSQTAWDERVKLAEKYNARVLTDLKIAAAFPTQHRLHAAPPDLFLNEQEIEVIRSSDVIVSFDWVDLARTLKTAFPENDGLGEPRKTVRIVHITLDYPAIHDGWTKNHFAQPPIDLAVSADVDKMVSVLLGVGPNTATEEPTTPLPGSPDNTTNPFQSQDAVGTDKISITDLAHALYATIPPSKVCLTRLPLGWKGADLIATHPLSHLGQDGGGGTGSGPGNAVGTALALKHLHSPLLPVAIIGDGDFLMGSSALWTAAHHNVPLLVIVANNASFYNDEKHQADIARERGRPVENAGVGTEIRDPAPDVTGNAVSFGAKRVVDGQVRKRGELEGALRKAVKVVREEGKLVVVDVFVWPEEEL